MYLFKKDGRYYIAVKTGGRWQRRSTGFSREADAKKVFRRISNRVADGLAPFEDAPQRREQSLSAFAVEYCERKETQGYDIARDTQALANLCGGLPVQLAAITRESIEAYILGYA